MEPGEAAEEYMCRLVTARWLNGSRGYTCVKTHNLLQVVNRREQCCAAPQAVNNVVLPSANCEQCCAANCGQCCAANCGQCCAAPREQCCAAPREQRCQQGCSAMITMLLQHCSTINTVTTCRQG